jgi:pseudouridine-5'-phosphate glycosidase
MLRKWRIAGALLGVLISASAVLMAASVGFAAEASPLSPADLKKLLGYIDTVGVKQVFPAPMARNLGLSPDEKQDLPVVSVVTNDHKIYFCRSELDAKDYIIWAIGSDEKSSSMFVTHQDLKLTRAMHLRAEAIPQLQNVNEDEVMSEYNQALEGLARDLKKSR